MNPEDMKHGTILNARVTNNYVSRDAALRYYRPADLDQKLASGEIKIGPPDIADDETLCVLDTGQFAAIKKVGMMQ